jgi:hypothetical protein
MDRRGYDGCEACEWIYFSCFMAVIVAGLVWA